MDHRKSIQNSLDFIEENLKAQITAAELSERAGYSLFHYYRLFQPAVGMPVMQYILRRRLLHAIYEIHGGRKRIDVILEYGFETYAGFYKAFRREFGCTPSVYLKKRRARRPCKPNLYQEEHMTISHKKAAALSRLIENAGLQAASPVAAADGGEYVQDSGLFFYVTRRLSGTPLLSHGFFEGDYAAKARFAGEMIGQLHLVLCKVDTCVNDVNLYETVRDWAMPRAKDILPLPEPFRREYLEAFGKLYGSLPRQIIHRDPHPGNIIVSQDKWGFIDFELSERNLRIYDPCYAALAVLSECFDVNRRDALDKWLEIYRNIIWGYDSVVKLTDEEKRALPYVVIANQLVCVAWFSRQDKYEDIFETNKRMTQWLISGFDELNI